MKLFVGAGLAIALAWSSSGLAASEPDATSPNGASLTPAAAATPPAAPAAAKKNRDDEIVCKSETPIGSRIPSKARCLTRGQWAEMSRNAALSLTLQAPSPKLGGP